MATPPQTVKKRHPIRAILWSIPIGIAVAIYLTFSFPVIAIDTFAGTLTQLILVIVVTMAIVTLLTLYVIPPKKPKGPPPAAAATATAPVVEEPVVEVVEEVVVEETVVVEEAPEHQATVDDLIADVEEEPEEPE